MRTITDIEKDLAIAYKARMDAVTATSYEVDSGQGKTSVKRNLTQINKTIEILERELTEVSGDLNGIVCMDFDRGRCDV